MENSNKENFSEEKKNLNQEKEVKFFRYILRL